MSQNKIDERYASPGLRWGLLLEDHPTATYSFELRKGTDLGIPEGWGEDDDYCVATIDIPGHEPVSAFKPLRGVNHDPDQWNLACTKALGRALKRAGYPDHMPDLKAIVLWRQRRVEIERLAAGDGPVAAIGPGEADRILEEATVPAAERSGQDFDEPVDAELVEEDSGVEATAGDDAPEQSTWTGEPIDDQLLAELGEGVKKALITDEEAGDFARILTGDRVDELAALSKVEGQRARLLLTMIAGGRLDVDFKARTFCDSKGRNVMPRWSGACSLVEMEPVGAAVDWAQRAADAGVRPAAALKSARALAVEMQVTQPASLDAIDDQDLAAAFGTWLDEQQRKKSA